LAFGGIVGVDGVGQRFVAWWTRNVGITRVTTNTRDTAGCVLTYGPAGMVSPQRWLSRF
jgi:hypothetical protein